MSAHQDFLQAAADRAFDKGLQGRLSFNIDRYNTAVEKGLSAYRDVESAKRRAKNTRWRAISQLDMLLQEFEKNFTRNGGKVIWARNDQEAIREIMTIIREKRARMVVKSKSMATEEIHLNEQLEQQGIEVWETDLGEYIVQLAGEKPFHIVTPAMHKSKEEVAALFHEKLGTPPNLTPQELAAVARRELRNQYRKADVGITGANFLIADTGSIAITENEGNARLCSSMPRIHIAVAGIDKMISSINDLPLLWPLLATHGTGQQLTVYNSILSGPKRDNESDGPEEMYVVLLDNGRSELLADTVQRESMYCIRCGACLNVCPVYKTIGGHAYGTTYSGPIGSVITPHLQGMEEFSHLSYASSLCGSCTAACPVKINLHQLLVHNRQASVAAGYTERKERMAWRLWQRAMLSRGIMNMAGPSIKQWTLKTLFGDSWGHHRSMPVFPKKTFRQLWKEHQSD